MFSTRIVFALAVVFAVFALTVEAYKKPPLNGSIFGKRSNSGTDCEISSRALSAICEAASEACGAWLSRQEYN